MDWERPGIACERLIHYVPLESQDLFHRSPARFKGFSGPIGSGKSAAVCHEAIKLAYVNPGRTGLLGAPTYQMLRDATQAALLEILELNRIPYEFNRGDNMLRFLDTKSKVIFRPLDEFERLRGPNLAWFGADELTYTSEEAWLRLEGRLRDPKAKRRCGFGAWTPKGFDWVYRRFIEPDDKNLYDVIRAKPLENRFLLEKVPDYYKRLKATYDEQFYAQEVEGEYLAYQQGQVYHAFRRQQNVRTLQKDPGLMLHWAMDFNVNPMCSVVVQIDGEEVRVLDEIVLHRASTEDACAEFSRRHLPHPAGLMVHGDANARKAQTTGASDAELVKRWLDSDHRQKATCQIPTANPLVRHRVGLVNAKLKSADGQVQLLVNQNCKELIADFEQVAWRGNTSEIDKERDPKRTHLSDALGYVLWAHFGEKKKAGERPYRLLT